MNGVGKLMLPFFVMVVALLQGSSSAGALIKFDGDCSKARFPLVSIQGAFAVLVDDTLKRYQSEAIQYIAECSAQAQNTRVVERLAIAKVFSRVGQEQTEALDELVTLVGENPQMLDARLHLADLQLNYPNASHENLELALQELSEISAYGNARATLVSKIFEWQRVPVERSLTFLERASELLDLVESGATEACYMLPLNINNSRLPDSGIASDWRHAEKVLDQAFQSGESACNLAMYSLCEAELRLGVLRRTDAPTTKDCRMSLEQIDSSADAFTLAILEAVIPTSVESICN